MGLIKMLKKLKKLKGFTLVELLAVLVVLAIIAAISVPQIMNLVEKAKAAAFEDSGYGITKAAEFLYANGLLAGNNEGIIFTYDETGETSSVAGKKLDYRGTIPKTGQVSIRADGTISFALHDGNNCIRKDYTSSEVILNSDLPDDCTMPWMFVPFTPTTISDEKTLFTSDGYPSFDIINLANGDYVYFQYVPSSDIIYVKKVDSTGNELIARTSLISSVYSINYNEALKSFDVAMDENEFFYISYFHFSTKEKRVAKFDSDFNLIIERAVYTDADSFDYREHTTLDVIGDRLYVVLQDNYNKIIELDLDLNIVTAATNIINNNANRIEADLLVTEDKIYWLYTLAGANTLRYRIRLSIHDRATYNQIKELDLTEDSQDMRYVGALFQDSLGEVWHIANFKGNCSKNAYAQQLINDTTFGTKLNIVYEPNSSVRATLLPNGEINLFWTQGAILKYKTLEK